MTADFAGDGRPGWSVAVSGNMVVVDAPYHPHNGSAGTGAAYVFVKSGSGWTNTTQTAELLASDGLAWLGSEFNPNNADLWLCRVAVPGLSTQEQSAALRGKELACFLSRLMIRNMNDWPSRRRNSLEVPHPDSPAGRQFDWASVGAPHPNSPAGHNFDYWSSLHRLNGRRRSAVG